MKTIAKKIIAILLVGILFEASASLISLIFYLYPSALHLPRHSYAYIFGTFSLLIGIFVSISISSICLELISKFIKSENEKH